VDPVVGDSRRVIELKVRLNSNSSVSPEQLGEHLKDLIMDDQDTEETITDVTYEIIK
jgi:hypothetical protein